MECFENYKLSLSLSLLLICIYIYLYILTRAIIVEWTGKGLWFSFNLASAWCWDAFQNSLSHSPCGAHHLSSCLIHTCQLPTDVCSLCRVFVRTTTPSPSSNPGWAKTIRQHLSWAQASCTAHYFHSHSNALIHSLAHTISFVAHRHTTAANMNIVNIFTRE